MKISWAGTCKFCHAPLDITITCKDSYEHYLYKKYWRLRPVYFADNIGYVRVMGLKCRRVCRACFENDTRLHVNPAILRDVQIGAKKMRPLISTSVTIHELKSFCDYIERNISREHRGAPIA